MNRLIALAAVLILLSGCNGIGGSVQTDTQTASQTVERTETVTDTPTTVPTQTTVQTATQTASPTATVTRSPTATQTVTPTPEPTETPALVDSVHIVEQSATRYPRLDTNETHGYRAEVVIENTAGRNATVDVWAAIEYQFGYEDRWGQFSPDTETIEIEGQSTVELQWNREYPESYTDLRLNAELEEIE